MRVLQILNPSPVGGLERVVQSLAMAQHDAGDEVHVATVLDVSTNGAAGAFITRLEQAGITVHRVHVGGRGYLAERHQVAALCRDLKPDVAHTHGYRSDVIDSSAARAAGIPTAATVHGFLRGGLRNRCYEWFQRRSLRHVGGIAAVSRPLMEELVRSGVPRTAIRFVPNAWSPVVRALAPAEARRALDIRPGVTAIGWIGRISREKGLDVMIGALPHLADLPVELHVIGDGPERAASEAAATERGVAPRLRWHGLVPDAERLMAAFDVVVLSSRSEGTPMVLLEAMAARVPVVATAVGGVPDVVHPSEGLLVESEDAESLAAAVRMVIAHPDGARTRVRNARKRIDQDFSVTRWLAAYRALYGAARGARRAA